MEGKGSIPLQPLQQTATPATPGRPGSSATTEQSYMESFMMQYKVLVRKNVLVLSRRQFQTISYTLIPTINLTLAYILGRILQSLFNQDSIDPTVFVLSYGLLNILGTIILSLSLMHIMIEEKKLKLLGFVRNTGLIESTYWLSWYTVFVALTCVAALTSTAMGHIYGLAVFTRSDFLPMFLSEWMFLNAMVAFVTMGAATLQKSSRINVIMLVTFLLVLTLQLLLAGSGQWQLVWNDTAGIALFFYFFMPWISFNYTFSVIALHTHQAEFAFPFTYPPITQLPFTSEAPFRQFRTGQMFQRLWLPNIGDCYIADGYSAYSGYYDGSYYDNSANSSSVSTSSPNNTVPYDVVPYDRACLDDFTMFGMFGFQLLQIVAFLLLAWYLAQVFGGDGGDKSYAFIFQPAYWGFDTKKMVSDTDTLAIEQRLSLQDMSIRCHKLSKSFANLTAVKELSMQIEGGKITAVLGPNGAGKSTTVGMLTGMFAPTHGKAFVCGHDVVEDLDQIRKIVGICYQHDPLWPQLNAREHLELIASFRGLHQDQVQQEIDNTLQLFRLDRIKVTTSGYSGGMKRRLLIAMSVIGSPRVVVLDEPTTGMDPLNRRLTWHALQTLKKKMLVLLVTHSMEEADFLADEIAIMISGKLRCKGTPQFLKSRFGTGYQIKLSTDANYIEPLQAIIKKLLPTSKLLGDSLVAAGELIVTVPLKDSEIMPGFFEWLEAHLALSTQYNQVIVKEWGISDSTLEDVFLRFAHTSTELNQEVIDGVDDTTRCQLCRVRDSNTVQIYTTNNQFGRKVLIKNHLCSSCVRADQERKLDIQLNLPVSTSPRLSESGGGNDRHLNSTIVDPSGEGQVESKTTEQAAVQPVHQQEDPLLDPAFLFRYRPPIQADPHAIQVPINALQQQLVVQGPDQQQQIIVHEAPPSGIQLATTAPIPIAQNPPVAADISEMVPLLTQILAVVANDYYIFKADKWANIIRIFVVLVFVLITVVFLSPSRETISGTVPNILFIGSCLFPFMASKMADDIKKKNVHMFTISGGRMTSLLLGHFLFSTILCFIWGAIIPVLLILAVSGIGLMMLKLIALTLMFSMAGSALALLVGVAAASSTIASILTYVFALVGIITSGQFRSETLSAWLGVFPYFAFDRAAKIVTGEFGLPPQFKSDKIDWTMELAILQMLLMTLICGAFALGVLSLKNFGLDQTIHLAKRTLGIPVAVAEPHQSNERDEDVDVLAERLRVTGPNSTAAANSAVCLDSIAKVYSKGAKRAVDGVSLAVDFGQTFALLGPNGAGKSTIVSMLSGLFGVTEGNVHVAGYDMIEQSDLLYRVLGVCPQHDILYDNITVEQHLLFYARLKGIPKVEEYPHVRNIAELIELDGDSFRMKAKELSGGMKRRLSIGISLMGNPRVWLLDEPTTGLDPDVRRQVWKIIQAKKSPHRATLITTHAMDEAETLCDHIGIMSVGRLKSVGTVLHLKKRFGGGLKLSLTMKESFARSDEKHKDDPFAFIDAFIIAEVSPEAECVYTMGASRRYKLPTVGVLISQVFQIMERQKDLLGIRDWVVTNSSLEEVFISIVRDDDYDGA